MKKISTPLLLVLGGIAAGAIVGLLLAPEEGQKTRKKWLKKAKNLKDTVGEAASDYKDKLTGLKNDVIDKSNEFKSNL